MTIDWINFTPLSALAGGVLIGIAVALLLLFNGRIAGVSGIIGALFNAVRQDLAWRMAFIIGLICAPIVYALLWQLPKTNIDAGYGLLIVAGLMVGFGARLGSGCTSGHGVCGISRLSPRSIIATLVFMGAGFLTVFFMRHILIWLY